MKRSSLGLGLAAAVSLAGLTAAVHSAGAAGGATGGAAPTAAGYRIEVGPDGTVARTRSDLPVTVTDGVTGAAKPDAPAAVPGPKLDPRLAAAVAAGKSGRVRVVVGFRDDVAVPRFPEPDPAQSRTAAANQAAQTRATSLVASLTSARQAGYQAISADLGALGATTVQTFWLIKGMVVDAPLAALPTIATRADVTSVEPVANAVPALARPAAAAATGPTQADARTFMGTDPYVDLGLSGGYVGVLGYGVRTTHVLFNNPSKPWFTEDVATPSNPNPSDCFLGTGLIGTITGNGNLGDPLRGVTGVTTDSFKVAPSDGAGGCLGPDTTAVVNGFQRAVQVGDRVILADVWAAGTETGVLAQAADRAFDAGAVVVAPVGDFDPGFPGRISVQSPANAQKALGVGEVDLALTPPSGPTQAPGPAADGRTKPDVLGPTNIACATRGSDTATAGGCYFSTQAAAEVAGAAALARNMLRGSSTELDPGLVYAYLLARGNGGSASSQTTGAGPVKLPVPSRSMSWTSQVSIADRQTIDIPLPFPATARTDTPVNVAIWWPEAPGAHNDVDLALVDPNGVVQSQSITASGVFEKVAVPGLRTAGTWKIRITGFRVPTGPQLVDIAATQDL